MLNPSVSRCDCRLLALQDLPSTFFLRNTDRNGSATCSFLRQSQTPPLLCCCRLSPNHRLERDRKAIAKTFCPHRPELPAAWHPLYPFSFWSLEICAESCFLTATEAGTYIQIPLLALSVPLSWHNACQYFKRTWKDLSCLPVKYGCTFYKIFIRLVLPFLFPVSKAICSDCFFHSFCTACYCFSA